MIAGVSFVGMSDVDGMEQGQLCRFSLWIDAVGGYLVCPGDELVVGQAGTSSDIDIPIVGDVARRHLRICRTTEVYVLEPIAETSLNGRSVTERTPLYEGNRIGLTGGVEIEFRKPNPLSMSATLQVVSRHRTRPWSDGIVLMAEACLLGNATRNHVVCSVWNSDLVIFRRGNELHARCKRPFVMDGEPVEDSVQLTEKARVVGDDFSLSLEPVED